MTTSASAGAIYPDLANKTVIVTGGGSGIGEAIVRRFAAQGSKTAFIDIKQDESRALAGELTEQGRRVHFEHADMTDIAALRAAIGEIRNIFGPIQILINNAAHDQRHVTLDVTPGAPHVFQGFAGLLDEAGAALDRAATFLNTHYAR